MAKQTVPSLPLSKKWPQKVRSAAVHAIALARLALTTACYSDRTTSAGTGLPPSGTTNLLRHNWATTTGYQLLAIAPGALDARTPDEVYYSTPLAIHATTQRAESGAGRG